jgi:hypothetical protein
LRQGHLLRAMRLQLGFRSAILAWAWRLALQATPRLIYR